MLGNYLQKTTSADVFFQMHFFLGAWRIKFEPDGQSRRHFFYLILYVTSVIKGRVFLGWTSSKLGLMFLLKDTTQWRRWGSNPRPLGLDSSSLPLSHCAPLSTLIRVRNSIRHKLVNPPTFLFFFRWESSILSLYRFSEKCSAYREGQPTPSLLSCKCFRGYGLRDVKCLFGVLILQDF